MSSARQAVVRGPNFMGFGKRPDLTPAHQVDFPTGIGPCGARMDDRRIRPVAGVGLNMAVRFKIARRRYGLMVERVPTKGHVPELELSQS